MATSISFIRWISPSECDRMKEAAANLVLEERASFMDFYGSPTRLFKTQTARTAISMLCASSNMHYPPQPLTTAEYKKYLLKKQYRGVLQVETGELSCDASGKVTAFSKGRTFDHPGYTPIAVRTIFGQPTFFYEKAEIGQMDDSLDYSPSCVTRTVNARSRIRLLPGGLTSKMALLNFPPWISRTITIKQCCNEPTSFAFGGSHFPSNYSYVNAATQKSWLQEGFSEFLETKGGTDARKVVFK